MYKIRLTLELSEESGVYTVTSPDVPGLVTEGATPDEISRNVEEALQGRIEAWAELGMDPATNQVTAAPDWGAKDLAPGAVRSIIRQLGISREEFGPIK